MKYDIIKTDNYLLILGDTFIWEGNEPYFVVEKLVDGRYDVIQIDNVNDWDTLNQYKILAHLPLNGNTLENIPLLPPLEQEDDVNKLVELNGHPESSQFYDYKEGFIDGFLEAKEKYKWTDEDVIKIVEKSRETGLTAEYLLLSLSQLKYPISFMFETEYDCCNRYMNCKGCDATAEMINLRPKTTSNSQGQTILVGKYIY